ncbi:MAG: hypothetical protein ACI4I5_06405 [Acutalibacteraceae bacterium]
MSNKEMVLHLIDLLPEYKLRYVIAYLQGLSADEADDDTYCAHLVDEYENSADKGEFVSFEDAAAMCGVNLDAVQN